MEEYKNKDCIECDNLLNDVINNPSNKEYLFYKLYMHMRHDFETENNVRLPEIDEPKHFSSLLRFYDLYGYPLLRYDSFRSNIYKIYVSQIKAFIDFPKHNEGALLLLRFLTNNDFTKEMELFGLSKKKD